MASKKHLLLLCTLCHGQASEFAETYTNPIVHEAGVDLGDPGALFVDGFYYLATSSGDSADAYPIHRSADLVTWSLVGHVFPHWKSTGPSWATGDFWAPDLQLVNHRFACYFSARDRSSGVLSLGVAFSKNITGPYVDIGQALWTEPFNPFGTIDVHFHQSKNDVKYLFWKSNQHLPVFWTAHIMMQRLDGDGAALVGTPQAVLKADQPWEKWGCVEAPWLLERNGTFYLFYSGSMVNFDSYAVGVGRSDRIEGPYVKKPQPVVHNCGYVPPAVQTTSVSAAEWTPGHCSVLPVAGTSDRWVMFYHGRDVSHPNTGRVLMMDELKWSADGWPYVVNDCPSSTAVPVPGNSSVLRSTTAIVV